MSLRSYLRGAWWEPAAETAIEVVNPTTDAPLGRFGAPRTSLAEAMAWGRDHGGENVRALTWVERGRRLAAMADALQRHRDDLLACSQACGGNTRSDAKFDVDGGLGVVQAYARWAAETPADPWLGDAEPCAPLPRRPLALRHVWAPRHGLALHVQAFNFPMWGLLEKLAPAWLAGMPVLTKPAPEGSPLAVRVVECLVEADLLPPGALQLWLGPGEALLEHAHPQDVLAFTGSAQTAALVRRHPRCLETGMRVNVEADSINVVVLGPDLAPGTALFERAIQDAILETTQKAGQKCTATRVLLVPQGCAANVREAVHAGLSAVAARTGEPLRDDVSMGPLASRGHRQRVRAGIAELATRARRLAGDPNRRTFLGVADDRGAFLEPQLFELEPGSAPGLEVFGPVLALASYDGGLASPVAMVEHAGGSLVATVYSDDPVFRRRLARRIAPWVGRLVLVDTEMLPARIGSGAVLPHGSHGGPGRAGDGHELGGWRALALYRQQTVVQGSPSTVAAWFDPDDA